MRIDKNVRYGKIKIIKKLSHIAFLDNIIVVKLIDKENFMRKIVAIVGDSRIDKDGDKYRIAFETGKALVDNGYRLQSGGLAGVMEAAFEGARASKNYKEGDTIAIIPSFDRSRHNPHADIVISTGLDMMRNAIVANADAVVAIGGGAGTLSEMAFAWPMLRLILAYDNVDGWSSKVAGTRLDNKIRYEEIPEDKIYAVSTPEDVIKYLDKYIDKYTKYHKGIIL